MPDDNAAPTSADAVRELIAELTGRPGWTAPAAHALGIATLSDHPDVDDDKVLDVSYPFPNLAENDGFAALAAHVVAHPGGPGTVLLEAEHLERLAALLAPIVAGGGSHPNAELLPMLGRVTAVGEPDRPVRRVAVITFLADLDDAPLDTYDVWLRLHLLSTRRVAPRGLNLEGQFGLLNNVVWTDAGPCDPVWFDRWRAEQRAEGRQVVVRGVDKFPPLTDYVVPSGVRIADATRVRLGAHLAEGTTVMHEGFVNFNAGTLGNAMVEGRISAGVVVGADTDIGGGASIMGTLSGGGKEVISIGSGCLLGANSGLGISLGDDCTVEAGLYVTAGTRVTLPDGSVVKAAVLSGRDGLLFRRNSQSGAVEVLSERVDWKGLNDQLHAN